MKISIIGPGKIGKATGEGFRRFGHDVTYYDKQDVPEKSEDFYFDITFFCVPEGMLTEAITKWGSTRTLNVIRSTCSIGATAEYREKFKYHISHNPEFLRERSAFIGFLNPDRIVIGECCKKHGDLLEKLYHPFNKPIIRVNSTTSELVKLASNAYLASLISFWNQIKLIADKHDVNSHVVGNICSLDPRIVNYGATMHGEAYGEACLPKDLETLKVAGAKAGADISFLEAISKINNHMKSVCGVVEI